MNKIAIITGGARGIGKEIANQFIKNGIQVVVTSRSYDFINLTNIENQMLVKQYLDVTSEDSVKKFFQWFESLNKKLFVLINNAGAGLFKPFTDITLHEWEKIMQTNLTGSFLCSKEAIKLMIKNGGGRIINIGSIAEKIPLANNTAYGVSKSGLKGLSHILNEEYKYVGLTH